MQARTAAAVVRAMDSIASSLEKKGLLREAEELDAATNAVQRHATDPSQNSFTYDTLQQYPDLMKAIPGEILSVMKAMKDSSLWWRDDGASVTFDQYTLDSSQIKTLAAAGSLVKIFPEEHDKYGDGYPVHDGYTAEFNVKRTPQFEQAGTAALQDLLRKKEYKEFDPAI